MATLTLSRPEPDLAVLTFDTPDKGANILSRSVLEELAAHFDALEKARDVKGLIFRSAKSGIFIAGADVREFAEAKDVTPEETTAMATEGRELFARLTRAPYVSVAAIDGICVGGGAELAVWCDCRLMSTSPSAQFGFPEVKLGLFPGWGGTARLPRIVGLGNAVEMITSGESIDARAAALMGLASDAVASDRLEVEARALVRSELKSGDYLRRREQWRKPLELSETELMFLGATASAVIQQQTKGQYPAPSAALELMLSTAGVDVDEAGKQESEAFAQIFGTPINRALINVFFLNDRNKKDPGIENRAIKPRPVKRLGMIGAGIMGRGIAAATVRRNIPVTITDQRTEALADGVREVLSEVSYNKATKGPDLERAMQFAPLVQATTNIADLAECDLVIEAIVENPAAKQSLYDSLKPHLQPGALLASNTSAISITQLAEKLEHPDRFCGIHFFNPVRKMPLVEVIRGKKSSDETVATAVAYAKTLGKSPIVVQDGPGFLVNRLLLPYMNEALELLQEGVELKRIEKAATAFGMPMGPFTLYDVVGLDTALHAGGVMHDAFPDRVGQSPVLAAMVKAGRLGQKSGTGFYAYDPKNKQGRGQTDPKLAELLAPHIRGKSQHTSEQITERLFLPMVLEATRVLEERIVRDPRDVDLGLIFGIGFPPFRGGLLFWADTLGPARIVDMLKPYESLGERYRAPPLLHKLATSSKSFYAAGELLNGDEPPKK